MIQNNIREFDPKFLEALSFETPFFFFSRKKILQNYKQFKDLFPNALVHFAMKANSEPEVLRTLTHAGCGFEVASVYELRMLKKHRVSPDKIIFGTSVKPAAHIKEFLKYGVDRFAFDSLSELEKIASVAPGSRVYIRIVANDSGSVFKFSEKFGTDSANVVPYLLRAKELGLIPYGVSFHVGSQASDAMAWAHAITVLGPILKELKTAGVILDVINFGGGYPCQYASSEIVPSLEEIAENTLEAYKKLPYQPQIMLEPGRGMIADTGVLVAGIIARIERKSSTWLFADVGVYNGLFETMAYQGSTRYPIVGMRQANNSGEMMFSIAGPTGDSPDVITRETLLPSDTTVGDKVVMYNIGAYSLTVISEFNGFPKPSVYYI